VLLNVDLFTGAVFPVGVFGLPWPLVLLAAASAIVGVFVIAVMQAAAAGDRAIGAEVPALAEAPGLALRVRRAAARWPLTELDPLERSMFAGAVAGARDFDELDLHWQELIIAAERGSRRHARHAHDLTRPT
jgi:hypothetical protein